MKNKKILLILGIVSVLAFTGCGKKEETPATEKVETQAPVEETAAETEAAETEAAETEAAETETAETETAETAVEETEVPETEAAETEAAETKAAEDTEAAETETAETETAGETAAVGEDETEMLFSIDTDETELVFADDADLEDESEQFAADTLAPINPSDYLIKNTEKYVTLCDTDNLSANQYIYEVTDEAVQEVIQSELQSYADEEDVDHPAEPGETVYMELTTTIEGEPASKTTDSNYFTIGEEDYGTEFDEQLIGVKTGDKLKFSIDYDEDTWMEDWAGKTVNFEATITNVTHQVLPEYTDAFVSKNTDFSSKEEYEAAIRVNLEMENDQNSYADAVESLISQVVSESVFSGYYPEDVFNSSKQEMLEMYSMFTGTTDEATFLEMFGISQEEFDNEVLDSVNRKVAISALCQEKDIEITDEEYFAYVQDFADYYGETPANIEDAYGRDTIVWAMYEEKAGTYLYNSADITAVPYTEAESESESELAEETEMETEPQTGM